MGFLFYFFGKNPDSGPFNSKAHPNPTCVADEIINTYGLGFFLFNGKAPSCLLMLELI